MAVVQCESSSAGVSAIVLNGIGGISGFTTMSIGDVERDNYRLGRTGQGIQRAHSDTPYEIMDSKTDKSWPVRGRIEFQNYSSRYREGFERVLRNIDMSIRADECIGIVGCTGASKSSVTMALFRVTEATEGKIMIDGDTRLARAAITTNYLSRWIRCGSLGELKAAWLKQYVSSLPDGLHGKVENGGENMSLGPRQLMILARTMLNRNTKVFCLGEATAAINVEIVNAIQRALRSKSFTGCVVPMIANRLNTILDSVLIFVPERGKMAEFDKPPFAVRPEQYLLQPCRKPRQPGEELTTRNRSN
ncbi:Canalicular multispecific organic anion transporter 2 [Mortierella sp. GBA30]|nr:Canalicular multispecific organic anion transporter 2 [Mortierella sp. GBA30]